MKLVGRLLLSAALVLLSATFGYSEDLYYGGYDGMWQGSLKIHGLDLTTFDETQKSSSEMDFRLQIKGATVRVFTKGNDWDEVKNGQFRIVVHKTSAVVYAADSANDVYDKTGSGGWVESWNFSATHKDVDTIYVAWVRSVNNYLRPPWRERRGVPFFISGFGEMTRLK
jgi:hypothetical protein